MHEIKEYILVLTLITKNKYCTSISEYWTYNVNTAR